MSWVDVLKAVLGLAIIASIPESSRRFEGFLQENAVPEPVARYAKYAGYALAALLWVALAGLVVAAIVT